MPNFKFLYPGVDEIVTNELIKKANHSDSDYINSLLLMASARATPRPAGGLVRQLV